METIYNIENLNYINDYLIIKFKTFLFNEKLIIIKVIVFLFLIITINLFYIFNPLLFDIYFYGNLKEFKKIEKYYKLCDKGELINKNLFKKSQNPKISIISPVYNREAYILRFLRSIQNQLFDDIEILFIDDFSKDNSVKIIEKYQKEDERIVLIKHNKNKGTLISRNEGVLKSKGEYIILPDPDDILIPDILEQCYNIVKTFNYEMIRFNIYSGDYKIFFDYIIQGLEIGPIYQPELSTYLFYGRGILQQIDFNISNKFIKRTAYINMLNCFFYNDYLNLYMINMEDGMINYALYRNIQSFYFFKKIGYYYIRNNQSITVNFYKNYDQTLKSFFLFLKFVFENSKNTYYEKNMVNELLKQFYIGFNEWIDYITKDFQFYLKIINVYMNCKYITKENKYKLKIQYLILIIILI